jgi:hypothetical protein
MTQQLAENHRAPTTEAAIRFLIIRSSSERDAQPVTDDARKERASLRVARQAHQDAIDASRACTADVNMCDVRLDRVVKVDLQTAVDALLAPLPEKARVAKKKKIFRGKAPSVGMKPTGGETQDQYVSDVLGELQDQEYASLAPVVAKVQMRLDALRAAEARRKAARTAEQLARTEVEKAVEAAQRFYNQAQARMALLFPDDEEFVESCFLDLRSETDEQSAESRKRVLLLIYRARFGAVPREVQSALKGPEDDEGFGRMVEVFATKSEEEIAGVVGVKKA